MISLTKIKGFGVVATAAILLSACGNSPTETVKNGMLQPYSTTQKIGDAFKVWSSKKNCNQSWGEKTEKDGSIVTFKCEFKDKKAFEQFGISPASFEEKIKEAEGQITYWSPTFETKTKNMEALVAEQNAYPEKLKQAKEAIDAKIIEVNERNNKNYGETIRYRKEVLDKSSKLGKASKEDRIKIKEEVDALKDELSRAYTEYDGKNKEGIVEVEQLKTEYNNIQKSQKECAQKIREEQPKFNEVKSHIDTQKQLVQGYMADKAKAENIDSIAFELTFSVDKSNRVFEKEQARVVLAMKDKSNIEQKKSFDELLNTIYKDKEIKLFLPGQTSPALINLIKKTS